MNCEALKSTWKKSENSEFEGWDFSYLNGKWENQKLPWDYFKIVKKYLKSTHELLDMGTGGGELLLTFNHPYNKTTVTERYEQNIKFLKEKLVPLGIKLITVEDNDILDFCDDSFDIVINCHESFNIDEIKRVLKHDGIFITQQVGGKNGNFLSKKLIKDFNPLYPDFNLTNIKVKLEESDFNLIYTDEAFPYQKFFNMDALIYYAKIIKWEFPNFGVDNNFEELLNIEKELNEKGYILNYEHRFIVVAKNAKK